MTTALDTYFLAVTAGVTLVYQLIFFLIAAGLKIDKVTDFAGTTNFVVLALLTRFLGGHWHPRQVLVTAFVVIWGLRLALFLLLRILQWGEDHRFDSMRDDVLQLATFWAFQALWVWVVSLPVTFVNAAGPHNPPLGGWDLVGALLWLGGLLVEAVADQQKLQFKGDAAQRGRWCAVGLWGWSRHPNYFGEILLWVGVFLVSVPVLRGDQWSAVLSPAFTACILLFASGMPLLEDSANKKYGRRADYLQYRAVTSPLIPLPPSLYSRLPPVVKTLFLLELPRYAKFLSPDEAPLVADSQPK